MGFRGCRGESIRDTDNCVIKTKGAGVSRWDGDGPIRDMLSNSAQTSSCLPILGRRGSREKKREQMGGEGRERGVKGELNRESTEMQGMLRTWECTSLIEKR